MKLEIKNPILIYTLKTIAFYLIAGLICFILELILPSGSHTPGLGYVALFLLMITGAVLFFINLSKLISGDKTSILSSIIHFFVSISIANFFQLW